MTPEQAAAEDKRIATLHRLATHADAAVSFMIAQDMPLFQLQAMVVTAERVDRSYLALYSASPKKRDCRKRSVAKAPKPLCFDDRPSRFRCGNVHV